MPGIPEESLTFCPAQDHSGFDILTTMHPGKGMAGCLHSMVDMSM